MDMSLFQHCLSLSVCLSLWMLLLLLTSCLNNFYNAFPYGWVPFKINTYIKIGKSYCIVLIYCACKCLLCCLCCLPHSNPTLLPQSCCAFIGIQWSNHYRIANHFEPVCLGGIHIYLRVFMGLCEEWNLNVSSVLIGIPHTLKIDTKNMAWKWFKNEPQLF